MENPNAEIILFHYSFSPYARRLVWYLALREIEYAQCKQPIVMPRPDLKALGINYRRIPVMSIGRDVYCDTRLMLLKLEQMLPQGALGVSHPDQRAVQKLLEIWTIDAGVFTRASQLIPLSMPLLKDPDFKKDREDYNGRSWSKEEIKTLRPEALAHIRSAFAFLETTLLADGREWILKTEGPSLADIEAVWPFDWLNGLKGALPRDLISKEDYPKVFSWIQRFNDRVRLASASVTSPTTVKGDEALRRILSSAVVSKDVEVDDRDPLGLDAGDEVEVWPTDTGFKHRDRGQLVGLSEEEVVLCVKPDAGGQEVRLHFPRTNFRIQATGRGAGPRL